MELNDRDFLAFVDNFGFFMIHSGLQDRVLGLVGACAEVAWNVSASKEDQCFLRFMLDYRRHSPSRRNQVFIIAHIA